MAITIFIFEEEVRIYDVNLSKFYSSVSFEYLELRNCDYNDKKHCLYVINIYGNITELNVKTLKLDYFSKLNFNILYAIDFKNYVYDAFGEIEYMVKEKLFSSETVSMDINKNYKIKMADHYLVCVNNENIKIFDIYDKKMYSKSFLKDIKSYRLKNNKVYILVDGSVISWEFKIGTEVGLFKVDKIGLRESEDLEVFDENRIFIGYHNFIFEYKDNNLVSKYENNLSLFFTNKIFHLIESPLILFS